jgi:hypothetical protein
LFEINLRKIKEECIEMNNNFLNLNLLNVEPKLIQDLVIDLQGMSQPEQSLEQTPHFLAYGNGKPPAIQNFLAYGGKGNT